MNIDMIITIMLIIFGLSALVYLYVDSLEQDRIANEYDDYYTRLYGDKDN